MIFETKQSFENTFIQNFIVFVFIFSNKFDEIRLTKSANPKNEIFLNYLKLKLDTSY